MAQTNARRSSGRRVQQKKTNSNRNLIIAAVVGVVVHAPQCARSRLSSTQRTHDGLLKLGSGRASTRSLRKRTFAF